MLKFQPNRTKPELSFFFFVTSLRLRYATEEATVACRFSQKKLELLPESLKLNGNIFFELSLGDLDEKTTATGYQREQTD